MGCRHSSVDICLCLPSCHPGFESQAHLLRLYNFYSQICAILVFVLWKAQKQTKRVRFNNCDNWAVVVAQVVERLHLTPEICSLNPAIGEFYLLPIVLKRCKLRKKRSEISQLLYQILLDSRFTHRYSANKKSRMPFTSSSTEPSSCSTTIVLQYWSKAMRIKQTQQMERKQESP